jgi:hypothetical protein
VSPIDSIFDEPALRRKSAAIASASTQLHDGDHFHEGVIEPFGGNGTVASPRTQESRRTRRDGCLAREMRKPNRYADGSRRAAAFLRPETPGSPRLR